MAQQWLLALLLLLAAGSVCGVRICIATHGLVGPVRTGGIATFASALASRLGAGHNISVLYLAGNASDAGSGTVAHWVAEYRRRGTPVHVLPEAANPPLQARLTRRISYQA